MTVDILSNLIQTAVLLFVFLKMIRFLGADRHGAGAVFFAFAVACGILSNLYWLAYDVLRPDTRMPFAANEIGELAIFLLLGAAAGTRSSSYSNHSSAKTEIFCTALFIAANVALWIAWSGEWVDDILTGIALGYFLCSLVTRTKHESVLPPQAWRILGVACLVLIAAQSAIFFVPKPAKKPLDLFCYVLLFVMCAYMLVSAIMAVRSGSKEAAICRTNMAFGWFVITMYMSAGAFYLAAHVLTTVGWPLMLLAIRKEADQ